jgi:hypothetical protein
MIQLHSLGLYNASGQRDDSDRRLDRHFERGGREIVGSSILAFVWRKLNDESLQSRER